MAAIGGVILIGGGLAYWYFSQQNGNGAKCTDYKSESECISHDCYWCNGACQSTPCGNGNDYCNHLLPGDNAGYGFPSGWRKCDPIDKDLCEWDNTNKKWFLIEESSNDCNFSHKRCYTSTNTGYPTCSPYPGDELNRCSSYGAGCPCGSGGLCQPNTFCCSDNICRLTAQETINILPGGWTEREWIKDGWGTVFGRSCTYKLPQILAANHLDGTLHWKGGVLLLDQAWEIRGLYNGAWNVLDHSEGKMWGDNGDIEINTNFITQGIEALNFSFVCTNYLPLVNVWLEPESFIGHLTY